jgi:hypothetical protein
MAVYVAGMNQGKLAAACKSRSGETINPVNTVNFLSNCRLSFMRL